MIVIDVKRWYYDTALHGKLATFAKDRVWFGWWWTSLCSQHGEGYNHKCNRCRLGGWTRTKYTFFQERENSKWAFGKKIRIRHD